MVHELADPRSPLGVVESFFQGELTSEVCELVRQMPLDQLWVLLEQLDDAYDRWLVRHAVPNASRGRREDAATLPPFQPIFSTDGSYKSWATVERWAKCALLYYPGTVVVPDPISAMPDMEHLGIALEERAPYLGLRIRASLADGLREALVLRPLMLRGDVQTVPFISIQHQFFEATRYFYALLQGLELNDLSQFVRDRAISMYELLAESTTLVDGEVIDIDIAGQVTDEWLWAGSALGYGSVAADKKVALRMATKIDQFLRIAERDSEAASVFGQFVVPGPDSASLADVVSLRLTDDAFGEFRSTFEHIIGAVASTGPQDDAEFTIEFRRSVEGELGARRAHVMKATHRSPSLESMLTGLFLFGAAAIEATATHDLPVGSLLAATGAQLGWAVPYGIERRRGKKGATLGRMMMMKLLAQ